jgi:y4mF family transcriptional regulator
MSHCTPATIGATIKSTRKALGVTQRELALTSGTGLRFIVDLEAGKGSCQLGKTLRVLETLGIRVSLGVPGEAASIEEFGR